MLTRTNKERLEQEIANLIKFIAEGREIFFKEANFSLQSSDSWLNHFISKELFHKHPELIQLELNIQLLYIKLSSYYQLVPDGKTKDLKRPRNAFAHELTDLIFNKRVKYNFFLHKVSENFKKIEFIFYEEGSNENNEIFVKNLDLNLHDDINDFLSVWSTSKI